MGTLYTRYILVCLMDTTVTVLYGRYPFCKYRNVKEACHITLCTLHCTLYTYVKGSHIEVSHRPYEQEKGTHMCDVRLSKFKK